MSARDHMAHPLRIDLLRGMRLSRNSARNAWPLLETFAHALLRSTQCAHAYVCLRLAREHVLAAGLSGNDEQAHFWAVCISLTLFESLMSEGARHADVRPHLQCSRQGFPATIRNHFGELKNLGSRPRQKDRIFFEHACCGGVVRLPDFACAQVRFATKEATFRSLVQKLLSHYLALD